MQGDVVGEHSHLIVRRWLAPHHLLKRLRRKGRVAHQVGALVGVLAKQRDAVADGVGGRPEQRHEHAHHEREDLRIGECVAAVGTHGDQGTDEVVSRCLPARPHDGEEEGRQALLRGWLGHGLTRDGPHQDVGDVKALRCLVV